ncbi:hypothetical protein [Vulcanococcus limneticus]|uniref:hypothetical protein n=1 Tax=Vulcanococcus limneticus TaxID=2170428 RepID=UPI00398BFFED
MLPRDAVDPQADSSHLFRGTPSSNAAFSNPAFSHSSANGGAPIASPASRHHSASTGSAVHHVIASELKHRNQPSDALAMMVNSMVSMVQAGKASRSRWSAS